MIETEGDQVTDLHLWRLGPGHLGAIVSVATTGRREAATTGRALAKFADLSHVTVEVQRPCPSPADPTRRICKSGAIDLRWRTVLRGCHSSMPSIKACGFFLQLRITCNKAWRLLAITLAADGASVESGFCSQWPVFPDRCRGASETADDGRNRRDVRAGKSHPMIRYRRTESQQALGSACWCSSARAAAADMALKAPAPTDPLRLDRILYRRPCRLWRRKPRCRHQSATRQGVFASNSITGLIGGYEAGYNKQFANHVVLGIEADASFASPVDAPRWCRVRVQHHARLRRHRARPDRIRVRNMDAICDGWICLGTHPVNIKDAAGSVVSRAWTDPARLDRGRRRRVCRQRQLERQARI